MTKRNEIRFSHKSISKVNKKGCFTACLYRDGVNVKTRSAAILQHGADLAYEMVVDWANITAKELNIPVVIQSKEDLLAKINNTSHAKKHGTSKSWIGWTNKKEREKAVDKGVAEFGALYIQNRALEMLALVADAALQEKAIMKAKYEAERLYAQALVDVFNKTGIDMSGSINDSTVVELYREMLAETT